MRVIVRFSAALMLGICGVLAVDATQSHSREVAYFARDMRLDHMVLGDAIVDMMKKAWRDEGRPAALRVPHRIEQGDRQLHLTTIDPEDAASGWRELPADVRNHLTAHEVVARREAGFQRTMVPVVGPQDGLLVLTIREPLAEETSFSRASLWRSVVVALGLLGLCGALTWLCGWFWVDRPIRALVELARRIGRGELETPLRLAGNHEFAQLAGELDAMRASLLHARREVARESEQRLAAFEQLRHADRLATVGRLAAGVAHELGTPLNVVGETAKMIGRGELAGAELGEGAGAIVGQAERMTTIIRQLLDFARPRKANKTPTELVPLCQRTVQFLDNLAQKRGVGLHVQAGATAPRADVDAAQIEQVLTNLVMNAIQATPAGGRVGITIEPVTTSRPGDPDSSAVPCQRIDVRDTGTGISPEHQRRLFEPFFTTKGVGEGTGLGLSVSRGIVQENGGWITVASEPGRGTCFSVFLPDSGGGVHDAG